ncbi:MULTISPECIES: HAD-IA family hydrolase [unclassified Sphingomonas]|uniref:HAD-IA family hydrolase n=1 Tax=unclassified Sphingomonas TaxID=196159 RepID=UPI002858F2E2|nr:MULTISPECIES: HAD-IA family hydrolase [unclassified Sphingomonas]MDR6113543.1 phosphoglycolate phosphatase [Sphingomonas sp. SORGH_AS_0789]MDR6149096.1 phosphoglycolate phosphatase [Sphingomonas sp. SORGH_AS_0742]
MTRLRLALFDCDGTLVDSQANICLAAVEAFALSGLTPPPAPAIRRIVGLSLVEAMRVLAPDQPDEAHHRLASDYKAAFFRLRTEGAMAPEPLFDGIPPLLDHLAAEGWLMGVATGKSDRGLARVLAEHGLAHHFVTLQTADRHPSKPDPAMVFAAMAETGVAAADVAMIGDTSFDMAMGKAAGAFAVGVAWGYHGVHELVNAGAQVVAQDVADLPALLVRA